MTLWSGRFCFAFFGMILVEEVNDEDNGQKNLWVLGLDLALSKKGTRKTGKHVTKRNFGWQKTYLQTCSRLIVVATLMLIAKRQRTHIFLLGLRNYRTLV